MSPRRALEGEGGSTLWGPQRRDQLSGKRFAHDDPVQEKNRPK